MAQGQASGRVTIKLDNKPLRSKPGASIQLGGVKRTGDVTDQGEFYHSEKIEKCVIKATMPHMSDTDARKLRAWRGTATFVDDIGTVYTSAPAVMADVGDVKSGEVDITIEGSPVK